MLKTLAAIFFSAVVAGAITGFPEAIQPVSATSADGISRVSAATCPTRGWPYQDCVPASATVRLVTTDRLD